ncbi:hypothetical protein L1049_001360 [Liquidambar formosana]|uniref:Folate-biopterin transporter 4 n=1 Tax=Liquidambar formosana TaxID=63359 RepID=A0AAP0NEJ4_LIQFO
MASKVAAAAANRSLNAAVRSSREYVMIFLTVQGLGTAISDVVVDAMIAEAARLERSQRIQLLSCGLVEENSIGSKDLAESSDSRSPHVEKSDSSDLTGDIFLVEKSEISISRRKKSRKNSKERVVSTSIVLNAEKDGSLASRWFHSIKMATYSLSRAFRQPIILRPMGWFFLARVTIPNLSSVMFYYQTEFLNLEASFLGMARVVGWIGFMLGTFIYNQYLKNIKFRRILLWSHVCLAFLSLLDIVLVSRSNVIFGISDKFMVLCGSALSDAIHQLKLMPFLILSAQLCPPGIEGTLFALFMSIDNFGTTVGSLVGAGVASVLNITSGSFDNLLIAVAIQVFCTFIPIAFLFLIPKEATGVSA